MILEMMLGCWMMMIWEHVVLDDDDDDDDDNAQTQLTLRGTYELFALCDMCFMFFFYEYACCVF